MFQAGAGPFQESGCFLASGSLRDCWVHGMDSFLLSCLELISFTSQVTNYIDQRGFQGLDQELTLLFRSKTSHIPCNVGQDLRPRVLDNVLERQAPAPGESISLRHQV